MTRTCRTNSFSASCVRAVSMMIGVRTPAFLSSLQTSNPSIFGSITSSRMRSHGPCLPSSRPWAPSLAALAGIQRLQIVGRLPALHPGEVEERLNEPLQSLGVPAKRVVEGMASRRRDIVAFLQQFGDVTQRGERRAEFVRDRRDETLLLAHHRKFPLNHAPQEVAGAGQEHQDGDEAG